MSDQVWIGPNLTCHNMQGNSIGAPCDPTSDADPPTTPLLTSTCNTPNTYLNGAGECVHQLTNVDHVAYIVVYAFIAAVVLGFTYGACLLFREAWEADKKITAFALVGILFAYLVVWCVVHLANEGLLP